jgi:hypothetical protein
VAGQLAPAIGGHLAVLGVEADDDVAAEGGAGVLQEAGFFTAAVPMITYDRPSSR